MNQKVLGLVKREAASNDDAEEWGSNLRYQHPGSGGHPPALRTVPGCKGRITRSEAELFRKLDEEPPYRKRRDGNKDMDDKREPLRGYAYTSIRVERESSR